MKWLKTYTLISSVSAFLCFWKYFINGITIFVVKFFFPFTMYIGDFSISSHVDVPHFLKAIFIEL